MNKLIFIIILLLGAFYSNGQDLENIKKQVFLNQFEKAKPEIDKYLSVEKNAIKAEGWYYKAFVYNSLAKLTTKTVSDSKILFQVAFDAIKKYVLLDSKLTLTGEEKNSTVFNIYYGIYDLGVRSYNDKNFAESYDFFISTLEIHDYIFEKNIIGPNELKFSSHDTDIVWNLAVLANELKKKEDVLIFYKKIADANLGEEKYAGAYDYLITKYKKEKNVELFYKYLAVAKKHYPIDIPYWEAQEIEFALANLENEFLLNKYEELTKNFPNNYPLVYNYALEIDKFLASSDSNGKDIVGYRKKIEDLFKKAVSINSTIEANLQLANIYYSKTFELQEQAAKIKGVKPIEIKLKNDLLTSVKSTMNEAIPFAEESVRLFALLKEFKFADKTNYKLALEILSNAYKLNGNSVKVAEAEKKKIEVEKL